MLDRDISNVHMQAYVVSPLLVHLLFTSADLHCVFLPVHLMSNVFFSFFFCLIMDITAPPVSWSPTDICTLTWLIIVLRNKIWMGQSQHRQVRHLNISEPTKKLAKHISDSLFPFMTALTPLPQWRRFYSDIIFSKHFWISSSATSFFNTKTSSLQYLNYSLSLKRQVNDLK